MNRKLVETAAFFSVLGLAAWIAESLAPFMTAILENAIR